jgi:hypothetical protein
VFIIHVVHREISSLSLEVGPGVCQAVAEAKQRPQFIHRSTQAFRGIFRSRYSARIRTSTNSPQVAHSVSCGLIRRIER